MLLEYVSLIYASFRHNSAVLIQKNVHVAIKKGEANNGILQE